MSLRLGNCGLPWKRSKETKEIQTFYANLLFCLKVHPSRRHDIVSDENLRIKPQIPFEEYVDGFGNICGRAHCEGGIVRFLNQGVIRDSGQLDAYEPRAAQEEVFNLPPQTLVYLLPSRYCEVDSELADFAWATFSTIAPGWSRVQAICDFVHGHIQFDYQQARATRTALDAFRERVGVCRDFTHLAVTLCRCMNIPARYLGDIGIPPAPDPMDFPSTTNRSFSASRVKWPALHISVTLNKVHPALSH